MCKVFNVSTLPATGSFPMKTGGSGANIQTIIRSWGEHPHRTPHKRPGFMVAPWYLMAMHQFWWRIMPLAQCLETIVCKPRKQGPLIAWDTSVAFTSLQLLVVDKWIPQLSACINHDWPSINHYRRIENITKHDLFPQLWTTIILTKLNRSGG